MASVHATVWIGFFICFLHFIFHISVEPWRSCNIISFLCFFFKLHKLFFLFFSYFFSPFSKDMVELGIIIMSSLNWCVRKFVLDLIYINICFVFLNSNLDKLSRHDLCNLFNYIYVIYLIKWLLEISLYHIFIY